MEMVLKDKGDQTKYWIYTCCNFNSHVDGFVTTLQQTKKSHI